MADISTPTTDVSILDNSTGETASVNSDNELLVHDQDVYDALTGVTIVKKRWFSVNFLNAGSPSMTVNGSGTPVTFSIAPTGSDIWYVQSVCVTLLDSGAMDYNKFGTITALTNGLIFETIISGSTTTVANTQTNIELMGHFHDNPFTVNTTAGFLSTSDAYMGQTIFEPPFVLDAGDSDSLQFRVRDNLSGLDYLRVFAHYYMEV